MSLLSPRSSQGLLPEWARQSAILLTWPRTDGDFAGNLKAVEKCYLGILTEICRDQQAVVLVQDTASEQRLGFRFRRAGLPASRWHIIQVRNDDVWVRDYGPLTIRQEDKLVWVDCRFDGWGGKYSSALDDQITQQINSEPVFRDVDLKSVSIVAEGGAIETNGVGTLMATASSVFCTRRNPPGSRLRLEKTFRDQLGQHNRIVLRNGHLQGDDTDGHIDTLARFVSDRHIVYQGCDNPHDSHYEPLQKMKAELQSLRRPEGRRYRLTELPLPAAQYAADGHRLPASYANYLITNQAVLVPTYADKADIEALSVIQDCFPTRRVVGIDCRALIEQHGSLHCATMQIHSDIEIEDD